jgi:hypothetical protein
MSGSQITSETIEAGQRPYGPTFNESRLVFRRQNWRIHERDTWIPWYVNAETAKRAFRVLVQDGWIDIDDRSADWFATRLTKIEREEPTNPDPDGSLGLGPVRDGYSDAWVIRIERPYDD